MVDTKVYNLTNPQKSIWDMEQYYKGSTLNNIAGNIFIDQKLDFDLLKKAINIFVKDNDGFRINLFYDNQGNIKQIISDFKPFEIDIIDLKTRSEVDILEKEMCDIPFKLLNNNLYNFKIFRFPNNTGGFVLVAHHLIYDAYTASIAANKITNIYSSLINKIEPSELPTSYVDFINSENQYYTSTKCIKDQQYWSNVYKTIPEAGEIPSNKSNIDISPKASRKTYTISKDLTLKISNFCKLNKISNFNFFMGLYAIYISRVSNLDDFVIGTPILNRSNFVEKNTPGMFVSTIPFRFSINENNSFIEFAAQVASDAFSMFRHQKYSYENIISDIRKIKPNQPNLYDIIISYQNTKTNRNSSKIPFELSWRFNNNTSDNLQIHLSDLNDEGILNISYDYRINKYNDIDIENIHSRIMFMINQVLEFPEISINEIELVTKKEKDYILNTFNNTKTNYPKSSSIVELFEEQVKDNKNKIASVYYDLSFTYQELNDRINSLANYLKTTYKIHPQDKISILLDKSMESIIAIFAILKLGAVYVPIDTKYPKDRIDYILDDTNTKIVLVKKDNSIDLDSKYITVDISLDNNIYTNYSKSNLTNRINPNDLAYIMYTSGSTGKPKGVMISHKNIVRLVKNTNYIDFSKITRILQTGSIVFDACTFEIYGSLLNGLTMYILNTTDLLNPETLKNYLVNNKIDVLWLTAPLFNQLCEKNPNIFSNVKYLLTGGDVLSPTHINMARKANPNLIIINGYGPTENTTFSCCFTIDQEYNKSIPIGIPISNSTAYVISKNCKLQPIGVRGELLVGGDGVGKGYLNRNDLTKKSFIKNPFAEGLAYKTGDLVELLPNGNIKFIGRIDNQVKIRGFRVELSEIDSCIMSFSDITKSYTIINNKNSVKEIITYITSKTKIDINSLKVFLENKLPQYMIPKSIMQLDEFPLNINGKIDKSKLPEIKETTKSDIILPKNQTEKALMKAFEELLHLNSISTTDNFFEIGGDSLSAIKLSSIIEVKLNSKISVKDIYDCKNIVTLAKLIDSSQDAKYIKITPSKKKELYNVSSAQKRIYYTTKIDGTESILYNMPGIIIFNKCPDIKKLNNCFQQLIQRHSSLRTSFEITKNQVYQKISQSLPFDIDFINVDSDIINIEDTFKNFVKPFDLSKAPLIRAELVKSKDKTILLFDMHHIISDGFSLQILTKELSSLYNDEKLDDLLLEYKDYSEWEFENILNNKFEESKKYWVTKFENDIPLLNMPLDYSRPSIQCYKGKKVRSIINEDLLSKINTLSKSLNASNNMILLACYYILLSKYSSQEDIIVGTPVVGRTKDELMNIIGMFVNSLPIKNHIDIHSSFIKLLSDIKQTVLEAMQHQDFPFDELINCLKIERDPSRNPLFDTMFTYQNEGFAEVSFNGLESSYYNVDSNISKFDLSIEIVPRNNILELNFEYCTKLFKHDTIERLADHYINIVNTIVDNPNVIIENINMISETEKNQILFDFNDTKVDYNNNSNYIQLFNQQVTINPNKTAVVFHDKKLTYKVLDEKSNQVANYLIKHGIKNNDFVGILVNRSFELIIAMIGILKAGAAYIPIDPTYPQNRIKYIIDDSGVDIILSQHHLIKSLNVNNTVAIDLENSFVFKEYSKKFINRDISPTNNAYLIYTSGSTGNPKGVIINHRNLNNFIVGMSKEIDFSKEKIIVSITTMCFDIFGLETLLPLQKGLTIVLADEEEQINPQKLNALCNKNDVNIIQTTPSKFELLIKDENELKYIMNMDSILLGGEPLPIKLLNNLKNITSATIYNVYGPTETTIWSSVKDLTHTDTITIGKPIANTQMYILDSNQNILPIGIPGELYIGGDGLSSGYYNRDSLTSTKFINNPFINNKKIYNTGDLAKWLPSGELICLGRTDFQIKLHGLRIELGEIESSILNFEGIENAVVTLKDINSSRQVLCGYIVSNKQISIVDLKKHLSSSLPSYMVPTYIVQLDTIPYTPNGKIDRKSLPLPILNVEQESTVNYVAPKTKIEIGLIEILEKTLKVSNVSILDNLFNLGGDSLTVIILSTSIRQKYNVDVSFREIMSTPVIKDLAKLISSKRPAITNLQIKKCQNADYYPTSSGQKRIYLATKVDTNSTLYNISGGILLEKIPDLNKLLKALETIVSRHEILRTRFELKDGEIVQIIEDSLDSKITINTVETTDVNILLAKYQTIFSLDKLPLFKIYLFILPNEKAFLMLDTHHIIFDGTSLNNLLLEISALYNDLLLPDLPISYKDYAVWEEESLKNNLFNESKDFWINQFKGDIPLLNIPTTYPRQEKRSYKGSTFIASLSNDIRDKIQKMSNRYKVTPYMLMLTAYYILLNKYSNQNDIVVSSPSSGRIYKELEPLLGVFINSIPLRTKFSTEDSFEDLLNNVKNVCSNALAHQDYPYDVLVKDLNIKRLSNRNPLFDTMFIYQNEIITDMDFQGIKAHMCLPKSSTSKFDISLEVLPMQESYNLSFEYCTELFDEKYIYNFANYYKNIINIILQNPKIKISDINGDKILPESDLLVQNNSLNNTNNKKKEFIAPKTNLEKELSKLFESLLQVSPIGIDDNFFELGGDSLLAINLQIELLKRKKNIKYSDIFMFPTIRELSTIITTSNYKPLNDINPNEFKDFDFILNNTYKMPQEVVHTDVGNIFITGSTGFLGAHVLNEFLQKENGIAYCLIRPSSQVSIEVKLLDKLHYYFGNKYDNYLGTRIIPIAGDLEKSNLGMTNSDSQALASNINCIINCAGKVTHFGDYNIYKKINVDGTQNLINLAMKYNKRFYHVSTISVAGIDIENQSNIEQAFQNDVYFKENNFYINQSLDNVYIRSKFEAEKIILQNILKGLDGYILRVGNLMNRFEDGKFQENADNNAFVNRLMSFAQIGCIPESIINNYLEFTPIDSCASAILKLMQNSNSQNRIFHLYDHNHVNITDFINIANKYTNIKIVSNKDFETHVDNLLTQKNSDKILSGILRDLDNKKNLSYNSKIKITSYFSVNYLMKTGFFWPQIDDYYLKRFLDYFVNIGLLRKTKENN